MFEDKTLVCKDCGEEFVFTAREQEFYESKGFVNEPQRCKPCRDKRKNAGRAPREMHEAVCAACGGVAKIPFVPRDDRPVYCSECFAKMKEEETAEEYNLNFKPCVAFCNAGLFSLIGSFAKVGV